MLADAKDYSALTLVNGLPNAASISDYFHTVPHVLEKADFKERTEDNPQGQLEQIDIRANLHRDADFYLGFKHKQVIAYVETSNGEQLLIGSADYPLSYNYERDSGAANGDTRETTLTMSLIRPI